MSKIGNPGDFKGLVAVRAGSKVWLMMYYTIRNIPRAMKRVTTYEIAYQHRDIFRVAYPPEKQAAQPGRFSRYVDYTVPASLPFGRYQFRATLQLGKHTATRTWSFDLGKHDRWSAHSG